MGWPAWRKVPFYSFWHCCTFFIINVSRQFSKILSPWVTFFQFNSLRCAVWEMHDTHILKFSKQTSKIFLGLFLLRAVVYGLETPMSSFRSRSRYFPRRCCRRRYVFVSPLFTTRHLEETQWIKRPCTNTFFTSISNTAPRVGFIPLKTHLSRACQRLLCRNTYFLSRHPFPV